MEPDCRAFERNALKALSDGKRRDSLERAAARRAVRRASALASFPDLQACRERACGIRRDTLSRLDAHLARFLGEAERRGAVVHVARDAAAARGIAAQIAREEGVSLAVLSGSMVADETGIAAALREAGVQVAETGPGEYFHREAGERRGEPFAAGMGVSGASFLVADTGTVVLLSGDAGVRAGHALPRVHLAVAGIESVLPKMSDLPLFLRLFSLGAPGRPIAPYVSLLTGAKREGDPEGPERLHVLLVDGGRSAVLEGKYREILRCVRCLACLDACPVHRLIGDRPYGWVYSGPMGAVLNPLLLGLAQAAPLADASTLCGACEEACPVKVPLTGLLLELRADARVQKLKTPGEILAVKAGTAVLRRAGLLEAAERFLGALSQFLSRGNPISGLPYPFAGWTERRDFPAAAKLPFRKQWKIRRGARG